MIQKFVDRFMQKKPELVEFFSAKHPEDYQEIVKKVVEVLADEGSFSGPDPERITVIDHGHYQGTLLFVIAEKGYQPDDYWYVMVSYGSCSGCDTLQAIRGYNDQPDEQQVNNYMTLALHIVQRLKKMENDDANLS